MQALLLVAPGGVLVAQLIATVLQAVEHVHKMMSALSQSVDPGLCGLVLPLDCA
jgi:hypothetical protein